MNWQEIAGGIMQAFRNAGVKKDVIDLQEKQLALLTKQITMLEGEKSDLLAKILSLEKKAEKIELELERLRPKSDGLDEMQIKFLQLLFNQGDASTRDIARYLGISEGMADYHRAVLMDADMILWVTVGMKSAWMDIDQPATFGITQKGRAYLVENKLV